MHPPPVDLSAPYTTSVVFTILVGLWFVAVLVRIAPRVLSGDKIPLLMVAGAFFIGPFVEPILDNIGLVWYAEDNFAIFSAFYQRPIPLFTVVGWMAFWVGSAYTAYHGLVKGKSRSYLWKMYALCWMLDVVVETMGLRVGVYTYFGPQPFNYWGLPLNWMFMNPGAAVVAGVLLYMLRDWLKGPRALLAIPAVPMTVMAFYGAAFWPYVMMLNSDVPSVVVLLSAVLSALLALLAVGFAINVAVPRDTNARTTAAPVAATT